MTRLSAHIQALRAEAKALAGQSEEALRRANRAVDKGSVSNAQSLATCVAMLAFMADAKSAAADDLEAQERALAGEV